MPMYARNAVPKKAVRRKTGEVRGPPGVFCLKGVTGGIDPVRIDGFPDNSMEGRHGQDAGEGGGR